MKQNYKCIIFDINGVLEFQGRVYPGAVDLINFLRQKGIIVRVLTNSTLKSRKYCRQGIDQQHLEKQKILCRTIESDGLSCS
ncbi:MAG: hypothetical protein JRJ74_12805 [Deltaproteobacteria bacterium]|nr:hypothetical protein [Deltaproteobacteria bacterium]